jgi:lipopolysaccharide transport system permease protein
MDSTRRLPALGALQDISAHRRLLGTLIPRDIASRYQGSLFGLLWSIATPLVLLFAYWFFLGVVMRARWGTEPPAHYPIILFSGLIVHQVFAEVVGRASTLVIANASYVRKVVFPIEILPWVTVATACFHLAINCVVLLGGQILIIGQVPATWAWLPVVLLPLLPMVAGLSWFVSSLGVYLRDTAQVVPLVITFLLFTSPIFYSMQMVPERFRLLLWASPLTVVVEQVRRVTIEGQPPDARHLLLYTAASLAVMVAGYAWFQRTKKGFADVL